MDAWNAPVELANDEKRLLKLCKKQKLWGFLRTHRHVLLDDEIRGALEQMYSGSRGRPPAAPERLLLAMLLQVALDVADQEVPVLTASDRRWQMILDCAGATEPLFCQGTVFNFRERARAHGLMQRLLDKTVELARQTGGFSHKRLRAIFDSSPLVGAGRVEDTFNLLGRAIKQLVEVVAEEKGQASEKIAKELDLTVFSASSVKAALDVDWRETDARTTALNDLIGQFKRIEGWLQSALPKDVLHTPPVADHIETVRRIIDQDTEPDPDPNSPKVSSSDTPQAESRRLNQDPRSHERKERLNSLTDRDQRHGRKSKTKVFSGYKRHVAVDRDIPGLICGAKVQAANKREHDAVAPLLQGLKKQGLEVIELQIDRGYLPAPDVVRLHEAGVKVVSKPPTPRPTERFGKADFAIDFEKRTVTCPTGQSVQFQGPNIRFPSATCRACDQRSNCIPPKNKAGRSIKLHPQEQWYREMAAELATPEGRAQRRQRTAVEHALAKVGAIQGTRARFIGIEKNQFDLQRTAVVNNLHVLDRLLPQAA